MDKETGKVLDHWHESAGKFKVDRALFWDGRMSTAAGMVLNSKPCQLSDTCQLLDVARREYDRIIIDRT